jgi:dTDP-glucose 4,6-dehydratase
VKILVTGGAGFIGSHFVRSLLGSRYPGLEQAQVTVLDKLTYAGRRANLPAVDPRLNFVRGDICDTPLLHDLVPGHDVIVHFAAESHVDRSLQDAAAFYRTNVAGTQRLLDAAGAAAISRIVHVSTDEVYGPVTAGWCTEESCLEPSSPYAASKAASDCMVRAYWRTHRLDVSIARCSNNYGTHQHPEKVVPRFITRLLEGEEIELHGSGAAVRQWLHVDDSCRAIAAIVTKGRAGEVYNVGGRTLMTNIALAEMLLDLCDASWSSVRHVRDRQVQDMRYAIDSAKIRDELGFAPKIEFAAGLAEVVAWYRDNQHWWTAAAAA